MNKLTVVIALGIGIGLAVSCARTSTALDPTHCNSNDGDDFCAREHPDGSLPFCRLGTQECDEAAGITDFDIDGCFADRPEDACYSACGDGRNVLEDPDCEGVADTTVSSSSSGTMTTDPTPGTSTTGDPTTDDATDVGPTDTTGGGCEDNDDCPNPDTPFCDADGMCVDCDGTPDGDVACAAEDPNNPVCEAGACVQCTSAIPDACVDQTPICNDEDNTCQACTEHSECPDSACHLDGADVGACFDEADVQMIANATQLSTAINGLGASDQAVLVLTASDYSGVTEEITSTAEVAIIASGNATISGNSGFAVLGVSGNAIVYFGNVTIGPNGTGAGVDCSGTSVWLDDSQASGNSGVGLDISGGCAAHLRRSVVAVNNAGGIDVAGGELYMANSVVGRNGDEFSSTLGGIALDGTTVDITYSTIALNEALTAARGSIFCAGGESGDIRNSLVVAGGNTVDGCGAALFSNNAVDDSGIGGSNDNVGAAMASWFANVGSNDFGLTAAGQTVFMDIAMWQDGDPLFDFEGDPIPTDMASFPGYDQP